MASVTLTPEQARFAADAVAEGRFRDLNEVVRAGLDLLQNAEAERNAFLRSLDEAQADGVRLGFTTLDALERDMDRLIEDAGHRQT